MTRSVSQCLKVIKQNGQSTPKSSERPLHKKQNSCYQAQSYQLGASLDKENYSKLFEQQKQFAIDNIRQMQDTIYNCRNKVQIMSSGLQNSMSAQFFKHSSSKQNMRM